MDWAAIKAGGTTSAILILAYVIYLLVHFIINKKFKKNGNGDKDYVSLRVDSIKHDIIKVIVNDLELAKVYPLLKEINATLIEIKNNTYDIKNIVVRLDSKLDGLSAIMDKVNTNVSSKIDRLDDRLSEKFDGIYERLGKLRGEQYE